MYTFIVLVALALSLSVLQQVLHELIPFRTPVAVTRTIAVAIGAGLSWTLGYSAFSAFGQALPAEWMHPLMTGLALVAVGELVRSVVSAIAHRSGEPADAEPASTTARAA
jgi:uncharacterized protein (DUF697 family)